jgi:hypothetical protein
VAVGLAYRLGVAFCRRVAVSWLKTAILGNLAAWLTINLGSANRGRRSGRSIGWRGGSSVIWRNGQRISSAYLGINQCENVILAIFSSAAGVSVAAWRIWRNGGVWLAIGVMALNGENWQCQSINGNENSAISWRKWLISYP